MKEHYYSGLEGLCRAVAGLYSDDEEYSFDEGVVARDIFRDASRFDEKYNVSRTWRLTQPRRIRNFVLAWAYPAERDMSKKSISRDDHKVSLGACVETMVRGAFGDIEEDDEDFSIIPTIFISLPNPLERVRAEVVPAMMDGFTTERYSPAAVNAFKADMDQLINGLKLDEFGMRKLLARLLGAAIFGPGDRLSLPPAADCVGTVSEGDLKEADLQGPATGDEVLLTQVFDTRFGLVGASLRLNRNKALFVGRSSDVRAYDARLDTVEGCPDLAKLVRDLEDAEVFRIPEDNRSVSNVHGVLFHNGEAWTYCDLGSTNGTVVKGEKDALAVDALCVLLPGDRLVLGTRRLTGTQADCCAAATLVFSECC